MLRSTTGPLNLGNPRSSRYCSGSRGLNTIRYNHAICSRLALGRIPIGRRGGAPTPASHSTLCRRNLTSRAFAPPISRSSPSASFLTPPHHHHLSSPTSPPTTAGQQERYLSSSRVNMTGLKIDGAAIAKGIRERINAEIQTYQQSNPRFKPSLVIFQGMSFPHDGNIVSDLHTNWNYSRR